MREEVIADLVRELSREFRAALKREERRRERTAFRVSEAAAALGISRSRVYELVRAGLLRARHVSGTHVEDARGLRDRRGLILISRQALAEFLGDRSEGE